MDLSHKPQPATASLFDWALKQEEEPSPGVERLVVDRAFGILDQSLNRNASRRDPQGVVRR